MLEGGDRPLRMIVASRDWEVAGERVDEAGRQRLREWRGRRKKLEVADEVSGEV